MHLDTAPVLVQAAQERLRSFLALMPEEQVEAARAQLEPAA